jgi:DNA sulfur modification protein DndB
MVRGKKKGYQVDSDNYVFTALRGIQAGREYYVAMCHLKLIPKMFLFNEEQIPVELRSQRVINKARIPEMASYLINNDRDYVFSSITASIDGEVKFVPEGKEGNSLRMGKLIVPMSASFLINDGQHRRAAIEEAIKKKPELELETISVVFYLDSGLKHSQQMFSDLNKHAIRPTKSLNILYNRRDHFSQAIIKLLSDVPIFNGLTELERTSISNRANKVFTLNSIYSATKDLLGKTGKNPTMNEEEEQLVIDYWNQIYLNISEWQDVVNGKVSPYDIRNEYVHVYGILLHAFGRMGNQLIKKYKKTWKSRLSILKEIDWKRSNSKNWESRSMFGGRLSKSQRNITLTTNFLKLKMGLGLSKKEKEIENKLKKGV